MERIGTRIKAWVAFGWTETVRRVRAVPPRRALAAVVALSLWMGAGTMAASVRTQKDRGTEFGEIHWYG